MKYGDKPKQLGLFEIDPKEMFFYQYLPIKLIGNIQPIFEDRLKIFEEILGAICCDFIGEFGLDRYNDSYIYLTAKNLYQKANCGFNRNGWHSDGFLTDDINYIWSDCQPTIFNFSDFEISNNDIKSMEEMNFQADPNNDAIYKNSRLLRLNQFNIHKVGDVEKGMRCFLKVSFSKDKYDLIGNSKNYLLNYNWEMRKRNENRNIPQLLK